MSYLFFTLLSIGFLVSGYWNFRHVINFGGVITRQSVAALMVITIFFVALCALTIVGIFSPSVNLIIITIFMAEPFVVTIGFINLAWILYTLGVEQGIAANNSDQDMKTFDEEFENRFKETINGKEEVFRLGKASSTH